MPIPLLTPWLPGAALVLSLAPLWLLALAPVLPVAWTRLLDWEMGKVWWQALAALLPPLIAVSTFLQHNSTDLVRGVTLGLLLLAIVLVQLYGRASDQRERIKTAARFSEQTDLLNAVFSEIREGRIEAEKGVSDLFKQVANGRRESVYAAGRITAEIDRIADGIGNLANYLTDKESENG